MRRFRNEKAAIVRTEIEGRIAFGRTPPMIRPCRRGTLRNQGRAVCGSIQRIRMSVSWFCGHVHFDGQNESPSIPIECLV
jgi:hypothetical protein